MFWAYRKTVFYLKLFEICSTVIKVKMFNIPSDLHFTKMEHKKAVDIQKTS